MDKLIFSSTASQGYIPSLDLPMRRNSSISIHSKNKDMIDCFEKYMLSLLEESNFKSGSLFPPFFPCSSHFNGLITWETYEEILALSKYAAGVNFWSGLVFGPLWWQRIIQNPGFNQFCVVFCDHNHHKYLVLCVESHDQVELLLLLGQDWEPLSGIQNRQSQWKGQRKDCRTLLCISQVPHFSTKWTFLSPKRGFFFPALV